MGECNNTFKTLTLSFVNFLELFINGHIPMDNVTTFDGRTNGYKKTNQLLYFAMCLIITRAYSYKLLIFYEIILLLKSYKLKKNVKRIYAEGCYLSSYTGWSLLS